MKKSLIFIGLFLSILMINFGFVLGSIQVLDLSSEGPNSTTFTDYYGNTWELTLDLNNDVSEGKRICYIEMNNLEGTNKFNYRLVEGVPFNVDGDKKWGFLLMESEDDKICSPILVYSEPVSCEDSDSTDSSSFGEGGVSNFGSNGFNSVNSQESILIDGGNYKIQDICANRIESGDGTLRWDPAESGDTLIEMSCLNGNLPYSFNYENCEFGCSDGECIPESEFSGEIITEKVTCAFEDSEVEQKCYLAGTFTNEDEGTKFCYGKESCDIEYTSYNNQKVTWKSSCGEYEYTTHDGNDEKIVFNCGAEEVEDLEEDISKNIGFRSAYVKCKDSSETKLDGGDSCLYARVFKADAFKFCEEKGGLDEIGLGDECPLYGKIEIITESRSSKEDVLICKNSCPSGNSCLPIGYRQKGEYCSGQGSFESQLGSGLQCDNSFECNSNVCVSGQCVSGNLIQKVLDWFRNVFGEN